MLEEVKSAKQAIGGIKKAVLSVIQNGRPPREDREKTEKQQMTVYKKPKRERKPRLDSTAIRAALKACGLAHEVGLMVLSAHAIGGSAKIIVANYASACKTAGRTTADGIQIEWRT